MNTQKDPVANLFTKEELESDKVFYYAEVKHNKKNDTYRVMIDTGNFKVSMRDDGLEDVRDMRKAIVSPRAEGSEVVFPRQLVSAGMLCFFKDKAVFLKRDDKAPVEPNKIQIPAGRCSETPFTTSVKEFGEEVGVIDKRSGKEVSVLNEYDNEELDEDTKEVEVFIDKKMVASGRMIVIHDAANNTLETFRAFRVNQDIDNFEFFDKEGFGREVMKMRMDELPPHEELVQNLSIIKRLGILQKSTKVCNPTILPDMSSEKCDDRVSAEVKRTA